MSASLSTADAVLMALQPYDPKQQPDGSWKVNSPLRSGSNSHGLHLTITGPEHGAWFDHVADEGGTLYQLAVILKITPGDRPTPTTTKRAYADLSDYAGQHHIPAQALIDAGWREVTHQGRKALEIPTDTGPRYRFLDNGDPTYKHGTGYQGCWYRIGEALALAAQTDQPLTLCNGEASTVAAQHHGIAATCVAGGGEKKIKDTLLALLLTLYPIGQPILIALDCDSKGRRAALQLYEQLTQAGYPARALDLNGGDSFDLADFAALHPTDAPAQLQACGDLPHTAPAAPTAASNGQILIDANTTDAGNAECLAERHGAQFRFCHTRQTWLVWDGGRWWLDMDGAAHRAALETVRTRYHAAANVQSLDQRKRLATWAITAESTTRQRALLESASTHPLFTTTIERYDADPLLAGTPSATLDLQTSQARPAARDDYLTMQLGVSYDAQARCPRWQRFLCEVFNGDQDLIAFVQRACGYTLTGDTREQKFFLCYGEGNNGKSVFLRVLAALLGDYAATASFDTFDAAKRNSVGDDLAALKGKRLVTIVETDEDRKLSEAKIKSVTGQDPVTCRHLYGKWFSYIPAYKVWLAMNHLPIIRGSDKGIWRRPRLIPFLQHFDGREDKLLYEQLRKELPGILNWALDGLRAWHLQGLGTCAAVEQATAAYRKDMDQLGPWMDALLVRDPDGTLIVSEAYESYGQWAVARGERFPLTQNAWARQMTNKGFVSARKNLNGRRESLYNGIRFRVTGDSAGDFDATITSNTSIFPESPHEEDDMERVSKTAGNAGNAGNAGSPEPPIADADLPEILRGLNLPSLLVFLRVGNLAAIQTHCVLGKRDYAAVLTALKELV